MGKITDWLNGKKTYIAALCAFGIVLLQAIVQWANGDTVELQRLFDAFIALAMIFLRKGVTKTTTATAEAVAAAIAPCTTPK